MIVGDSSRQGPAGKTNRLGDGDFFAVALSFLIILDHPTLKAERFGGLFLR